MLESGRTRPMSEFNPYAAPVTEITAPGFEEEVWRNGKVLIMTKRGRLPDRCVKCNAPSSYRLKRNLMWHSPIWYILDLFPGLLFM